MHKYLDFMPVQIVTGHVIYNSSYKILTSWKQLRAGYNGACTVDGIWSKDTFVFWKLVFKIKEALSVEN